MNIAAISSNIHILRYSGLPIRKFMLPEILFAKAGAGLEVVVELRAVVKIKGFRVLLFTMRLLYFNLHVLVCCRYTCIHAYKKWH